MRTVFPALSGNVLEGDQILVMCFESFYHSESDQTKFYKGLIPSFTQLIHDHQDIPSSMAAAVQQSMTGIIANYFEQYDVSCRASDPTPDGKYDLHLIIAVVRDGNKYTLNRSIESHIDKFPGQ